MVISALLFVLTFSALRIWAPTFASSEKLTILGGFVSSLLFFFSLLVPSSSPPSHTTHRLQWLTSPTLRSSAISKSARVDGFKVLLFLSLAAHPNSHPIASCRSVCELGYRHGHCRYRPQSLRHHMVPPLRPILSLAINRSHAANVAASSFRWAFSTGWPRCRRASRRRRLRPTLPPRRGGSSHGGELSPLDVVKTLYTIREFNT